MAQTFLRDVNVAYDRLTEDEFANLGIVFGAYRSFRGRRRAHIAYVSMPITTGERYYDVFGAYGVRTKEELNQAVGPNALRELVVKPNIEEGIVFVDKLGRSEDLLFTAPSVFEAEKWRWSEDAYMSLWYRVIGEMAGSHVVMDGWQYSTGGVKEVVFSMLLKRRVIRPYTQATAVKLLG
jgi:hypothetical protein